MGAESSLFKKCTIDSEVQYSCKDWTLYNARHDSQKFSLFIFNDNKYSFDITLWKTIKHPFIVKYYDCGVFRGKKCVVTEPVEAIKPLLNKFYNDLTISGLQNIANAMDFVHNKCNLSINNLNLDSIFKSRTESTDCWKLGSLFCLSSIQTENSQFTKNLLSYHKFLGTTNMLPPEDLLSTNMELLRDNNEIHRRDVYAFGLLLNQLLTDVKLSERMQSLKNENIEKRPNIKSILSDEMFSDSDFVQIKSFLTNFGSYAESDRKVFLSNLVERLRNLSTNLVVSLISLMVSSRLILSNPDFHTKLMPFILIPICDENEETVCQLFSGESITLKPLLNKNIFKSQIIPLICKLYCVRDLRMRLLLLQYLPYYANLVSKECLRQFILPQLLLGLKDPNNDLVSLTFKALSHLVTVFDATVVIGPRIKIFSSGLPKLNQINSLSDSFTESDVDQSVCQSEMSERSSPDGRENSKLINQIVNHEWDNCPLDSGLVNNEIEMIEPNIVNENLTPNQSSKSTLKKTKSSNNKSFNNDFDFKQLDFKLETNEIDVLFSDMEPVLKFAKHSLIPENLNEFDNMVKNPNIFAANEENAEAIGWTDQDWDNDWDKDNN